MEKFELGKTYIHSSDKRMKIVGMAETVCYGSSFIGEDEQGNLSPVQIDCKSFPEATIGWVEVN